MKKRAIQILLALSLIFYKSTWFWRVFNHLAKPYLPASREFFQIVAAEVLHLPFTGLHHFIYV